MRKQWSGLSRRITVVQLLLMMTMAAILVAVSYSAFRSTYMRFYNEKAQDIVRIVAAHTDWERLEPFAETGVKDAYAEELTRFFNQVKENFTGVGYLYMFIPGEDSFTYLLEAQTAEDDPGAVAVWGDVFHYTEYEYEKLLPDVRAGKPSTELMEMATEMGRGLEAWAPVFDASGAVRAMVEADYVTPEFSRELNSYVLRIILIFLLCILAVLAAMLVYLRKSVLEPIEQLNESVNAYEHGRLRLDLSRFRQEDELKRLASSFGDMTQRIERYTEEIAQVTAEKERIGAELNVAARIQSDMLPRVFPPFPDRKDFEIYALMNPAKEVGGDFYDFFLVDDDHLAMVMADVSGKGVPAALFMVITKTFLKDRTMMGGSPAQILRDVNSRLCEGNDEHFFVTVWLGILDLRTGRGMAANAGHEHPLLRRGSGGRFQLVEYRHAPAMAVMENMPFEEHEFQLRPGDCLLVYTDGVPEATNSSDDLFGLDRMLAALNQDSAAPPEKLLRMITHELSAFTVDAPQFDDITMLVMEYRGPDTGAPFK